MRRASLGWFVAIVGGIAVLHVAATPALAPPPLTHPARLGPWLEARDPLAAAFATIRLAALAAGWYLLAVTALAAIARVARWNGLRRLVRSLTVPGLRSVVGGAVGLSLTAATLAGPAGAATFDDRDVPVMVVDDGRPPPVLRRLPDEPEGPAAQPASPPPSSTVVIRPGDHLWRVAERTLANAWDRAPADAEVVPYWRALIEENRSRLADPGNPDLVFAGQQFQLPPIPRQRGGPGAPQNP